jgi:pSer/pThr/pTyr-binding forkhead associated (FHA) protein
MASLCLLSEDGRPARQWEIGERPVAVGRGASVDVKLNDEGLSRRHFVILREGEHYVLRDLGSRNGTWVDGERALTARLQHDDRILAGRTEFRFAEDGGDDAVGKRGIGPHGTVVLPLGLGQS